MAPLEDQSCLGCSKKFNKSDYCLQCVVCSLWIHKSCSGISDEGFKYVNDQLQTTGMAYWACRPCTSYAMSMNHRLKQVEEKVEKVTRAVESNSAAIKEVDKKVESISQELKKKDSRVEDSVKDQQRSMYEELRDRELRKRNVIFHGIMELQQENSTYKERTEWDRKSIENICKALHLDIGGEAVKFSRRIGESGDTARPLLTGFHMEADKLNLLRVARNLMKTNYSDVNIVPDLTKKQREEEADLKVEAERRNRSLPVSDTSKNLHWVVVGARGERRLTKEKKDTERDHVGIRDITRGGRGRGAAPHRGRGTGGSRVLSGANAINRGPARETRSGARTKKAADKESSELEETEEMETESEEETETETETELEKEKETATGRKKRKERSGGNEREGPPVKK